MFAALLSFVLMACSDNRLAEPCGVTGRQRSCGCPAPALGVQVCGFNGLWEKCQCFQNAGAAAIGGAGGRAGAGGAAGASGPAAGTAGRAGASGR
jgi:hypothetical protein